MTVLLKQSFPHHPSCAQILQPLGKGQLQRLFHNLCANAQTREVRLLKTASYC